MKYFVQPLVDFSFIPACFLYGICQLNVQSEATAALLKRLASICTKPKQALADFRSGLPEAAIPLKKQMTHLSGISRGLTTWDGSIKAVGEGSNSRIG
jgi:hypothetical protein